MKHPGSAAIPIKNRYVLYALLLLILVTTAITIQNLLLPPTFIFAGKTYTQYNNYIIFVESFSNLLAGENMYIRHTDVYADLYKYSPTFALVMAPFKALPVWAGLWVWNVTGILLLLAGLKQFNANPVHLFLLVLILTPEAAAAVSNSQSNTHIAGLLLLSASAMERGKTAQSTLFLVSTVFIKIFTGVLVLFYLLYPRIWRSAGWFILWTVLFFIAPVVITGFTGLIQQYHNWWEMLRADHADSIGYSVAGILDAISSGQVNKDLITAFGGVLLLLPLIKWRAYSDYVFRISYFSLVVIWMVVFNHKAESPTFIIAMTGVVILAHVNNYQKAFLILLCASLIFTSLTTTDLCPRAFRATVIDPYRIKALFPSLTFFYAVYYLLFYRKSAIQQV
jgi:hypothetical protein